MPPPLAVTSSVGSLEALSRRFWRWRVRHQPRSRDDIPRVERPHGWRTDWTLPAIDDRRRALDAFDRACGGLSTEDAPVAVQVDHRLLTSAIARARWEIDVLRLWQRHPGFYVDQSLGEVFELMLPPPPVKRVRGRELLRRLSALPGVLAVGMRNLQGHAVAEFSRLTMDELADVGDQVLIAMRHLRPT